MIPEQSARCVADSQGARSVRFYDTCMSGLRQCQELFRHTLYAVRVPEVVDPLHVHKMLYD